AQCLDTPYSSKTTRSRSSPRPTINRINPPGILKKQRDWRVQSKQPKILVRSDALKTRPIVIRTRDDAIKRGDLHLWRQPSISRGAFDDVPLKPLHCEQLNSLSS